MEINIEYGKIWERVLPVVMDDVKLRDKEVFERYYKYFVDRQKCIIKQQFDGIIPLTKSETNAAEFGYYIEDLKNMYKYLADTNYRFDDYSVLVGRIREELGLNSPETSQNNAQQGGNAGTFIHNENKGGVQISGGTMKGNITINNTFNTNPTDKKDEKKKRSWFLIPILIPIVFVVSVVVYKTNSGSQNNESKVDSTTVSENPDTLNIAIIADTLTPQFNYLTFTAQEPNSSVGIKNWDNNPDIEYSIDEGETWQKLTEQNSVVLRNIGDKMLVRGNNPEGFSKDDSGTSFIMSGKIAASGSVMSLIDGKGEALTIPSGEYCFNRLFDHCVSLTAAPELPATTLAEGCYQMMFSYCKNLTVAPDLPATILAEWCYCSMFYGCTSLTSAPKLQATNLAGWCYHQMFILCRSLTTAPELPATTLAKECYSAMFSSCSSLLTAPELPATTLATKCYAGMFSKCTGLTAAPELPATTLADQCYENMFYGCTSLTTAPELSATTLATKCYSGMFYWCRNLKSVKVRFVDWKYDSNLTDKMNYDNNPTGFWLDRVASSGTFYCPRALSPKRGVSFIPNGWKVEYID